jgi:hypothetical protein
VRQISLLGAIILAHLFYGKECCSDNDCHPVPCSEVTTTDTGWMWQDRRFTRDMLKLSEDGGCHVCVSFIPLCIYLPAGA